MSAAGKTKGKIVVRKTPNGLHRYTASVVRGNGVYGWGNTPTEARAKLSERLAVTASPSLTTAERSA